MICTTLRAREFAASHLAGSARERLTKTGSDFQRKLDAWANGLVPIDSDGTIALVLDHGEVIGWARTESWHSGNGVPYDTLEAFVSPEHRLRGIAAFAASAIYAAVLHDSGGTVAVFHPHMLLVAKRAGFWPVLFEKGSDGGWRQA